MHEGLLPPESEPATHGGQAVQASLHLPTTRTRATSTTFGPWMRIGVTLAIIAPLLVAAYIASTAGLLVVAFPFSLAYLPLAVKFLRGTWSIGRFDGAEAGEDDAIPPGTSAT